MRLGFSLALAVALLLTLVSGSMLKQQMLSADRTGDTYDDTAFAVLMVAVLVRLLVLVQMMVRIVIGMAMMVVVAGMAVL